MGQYSIKEALDKMLQSSVWKDAYLATKLQEDWEILVGRTVAKYTDKLEIRGRTLYVYTKAGPLKQELNYNKAVLLERIAAHLGSKLISDIAVV
jgi:hypothetical protein